MGASGEPDGPMLAQNDEPIIARLAVLETQVERLRTEVDRLPRKTDLENAITGHENRMLWAVVGLAATLIVTYITVPPGVLRRRLVLVAA